MTGPTKYRLPQGGAKLPQIGNRDAGGCRSAATGTSVKATLQGAENCGGEARLPQLPHLARARAPTLSSFSPQRLQREGNGNCGNHTRDGVRQVARLREAAEVVRLLRQAWLTLTLLHVAGCRPAGYRSWWPDVVRNAFEAYNDDAPERARLRPAVPGPGAIADMDRALAWLLLLSEGERRLVWARAMRVRWRWLERRMGKCERRLRDDYWAAIGKIVLAGMSGLRL